MQLISHFLQSSLYFFRPRSSRKNAHSLFRYFGIRGIAPTSFLRCLFADLLPKRKNARNRIPLYVFGAILGVFFRYERLSKRRRYPYRPSFKSRCLSLPGNKKAPYCYDAFVLLGNISSCSSFSLNATGNANHYIKFYSLINPTIQFIQPLMVEERRSKVLSLLTLYRFDLFIICTISFFCGIMPVSK